MTDKINRGDLYWILAESLSPDFAHPYLVVQENVFNHSRISTVVVCALTTNLKRAREPGNVLLDEGEGALPRQSVVVVSQIASIEKSALGPRIGSLHPKRVEQVLAGLRFQQRSFYRG